MLCVVLFLTFLDNTIVSVALADIQSRLHAGVQTLQWVVDGYALPKNTSQGAKSNPAAAAAPELVQKVIHAAERAFYTGLHTAMLVSAALLFAGAVVAFIGLRHTTVEETGSQVEQLAEVA